jgi:Flp pilus assembly pilin Flp
MRRIKTLTQLWPTGEAGQDAAEYALLFAFLVIVVLVGVMAYGTALAQFWAGIVAALP